MERAIIKKRKGDKQQHIYSIPYVMYDKQDRKKLNKAVKKISALLRGQMIKYVEIYLYICNI